MIFKPSPEFYTVMQIFAWLLGFGVVFYLRVFFNDFIEDIKNRMAQNDTDEVNVDD